MNLTCKTVTGVIYASLFLVSTSATALSLGKLHGAAIFGRELNVTVPVQYAADEDIVPSCFVADVGFGASAVDASLLSVTVQPTSQANTRNVRISTSSRVDDAVVTVNLRTTCGPKASRQFVLLADVLSEQDLDTGAVPPQVATETKATGNASDGATVAAPVPQKSGTPPAAKKPVVRKAVTAPFPAPAPTASGNVPPAKAPSPLNSTAIADLEQRLEALEQRPTQGTDADVVPKNQDSSKALEADVQGLKALALKNQQSLQSLSMALASTEGQGYGRSVAYALLALLVLGMTGVAYVFSRTRSVGAHSKPWWLGGDQRAEPKPLVMPAKKVEELRSPPLAAPVDVQLPVSEPEPASATFIPEATVPVAAVVVPSVVDVDFDIDLDVPDAQATAPTVAGSFGSQNAASAGHGEAANSAKTPLRALNTQEMLDIRQQAEFFMALGQYDDAIDLLVRNIQDSDDANPLVFLDLLKIFHTLSRREDFERYRKVFNLQFTGRVPPYADFLMDGNGLDAYVDICQQIVVLWPTEYAVDYIEQCLVRTSEDDPEQGIDLDAFKDLLLLYGILKRLDQAVDSVMVPFSASRPANSEFGSMQTTPEPKPLPLTENNGLPLISLPGEPMDELPKLDVELDLDISPVQNAPADPDRGNLIDFDVSGLASSRPDKTDK